MKKAGRVSLLFLMAAFAAVLLDDLTEWSGFEVDVPFYSEASGSADFLHF